MATITKRESGRWQAKIRRNGQSGLSRTFARQIDAEAWSRKVESEQERGVWRDMRDLDGLKAQHLFDRYLREVACKKKSAKTIGYHLDRFGEELGKLPLTALAPEHLIAWRDARLQCVSSSTVARELSTLGGLLTWARKDLRLPIEHLVSAIRRPPPGKARDRRLEDGEYPRLLEALSDHAGDVKGSKRAGAYRVGTRNPWILPMMQLAIETAMRRGELLALRWPDVDMQRRTALLRDTKDHKGQPRERTIPLSSRAVAVLAALPRTDDVRVFPTTTDSVKSAWRRACARAEIDNLHFHDLRHEAASRLAEKLPNLIELAAVTGHKDLRMLQRYYHPRASDLAKKLG
jgi:integrase